MENEENEKFYVFFSHTAEPSTGNAGCCPCTAVHALPVPQFPHSRGPVPGTAPKRCGAPSPGKYEPREESHNVPIDAVIADLCLLRAQSPPGRTLGLFSVGDIPWGVPCGPFPPFPGLSYNPVPPPAAENAWWEPVWGWGSSPQQGHPLSPALGT